VTHHSLEKIRHRLKYQLPDKQNFAALRHTNVSFAETREFGRDTNKPVKRPDWD